jgi:hypothetical protein
MGECLDFDRAALRGFEAVIIDWGPRNPSRPEWEPRYQAKVANLSQRFRNGRIEDGGPEIGDGCLSNILGGRTLARSDDLASLRQRFNNPPIFRFG